MGHTRGRLLPPGVKISHPGRGQGLGEPPSQGVHWALLTCPALSSGLLPVRRQPERTPEKPLRTHLVPSGKT